MNTTKKGLLSPMFIIGALFFVFGFISWLNAILIPYFKLALQLTLTEAMMVAFAFYLSYFVMALPSSRILERTGLKKGMIGGLLVMAVGALFFIPAALYRNYPLFLVGLFVQATGLTLLQTAANPYVTILGPIESAASRMSIMGICNKVAGAIAPLLLLKMITKNPDEIDALRVALPSLSPDQLNNTLHELTTRLIEPYIIIAVLLVLLGLVIYFSGLPDIKNKQPSAVSKDSVFKHPHLILGAVAIFSGVSLEVITVDSIISYAEYQGYSFLHAKYFATFALIFMIAGYLTGIYTIPRWLDQQKALAYSAIAGITLTAAILIIPGKSSVWMLAVLGCCNALIWPSIWPLALKNLGGLTEKGAALLIMGIVGGAITPLLFGELAGTLNLQKAYIIMFPLYLFLLYYAVRGSRTTSVA